VLDGANGAPLPAGTYHNVLFRLYAAPTGGTALWSETQDISISGTHGVFAAALGSVTPLPASLHLTQPLWLGIEVGTDPEMTPRMALSTAASADALVLPYTGYQGTSPDAEALAEGAAFTIRASDNIGVAGLARGYGVVGITDAPSGMGNTGVYGSDVSAQGGYGLLGESTVGVGAAGLSNGSDGVRGATNADTASGVTGSDHSQNGGYGVFAYSDHGIGFGSLSHGGDAVKATTSEDGAHAVLGYDDSVNGGFGVYGQSDHGVACVGSSSGGDGVQGYTFKDAASGVVGSDHSAKGGYGVYGFSAAGWAGYFDGKVHVGSLNPSGSDVAEEFPTSDVAPPGTVMTIDPLHPGALRPSATSYDRKAAGVVSGANGVNAGVVLPDVDNAKRAEPVAMSGRVWVRCNTEDGPVAPGDLLTTSDTAGEAMKVDDYSRSPGATIGKAMTALNSGDGLVLALVNLE
jgi:hypothetical protein